MLAIIIIIITNLIIMSLLTIRDESTVLFVTENIKIDLIALNI